MARPAQKAPPRLALFDRLLQGDSIETDRSPERAQREFRESVRRDLEILFNTRSLHLPIDPHLQELRQSVLSFGLPDLVGRQTATPQQQRQFELLLTSTIARFEPRFKDLTVTITPGNDFDRVLRFQIQAVLEADNISEAVTYQTSVDPVSGGLAIRDA
jgi:type VI secretion system protein ImpF